MFIEQLMAAAADATIADGAKLLSAGHLYVRPSLTSFSIMRQL